MPRTSKTVAVVPPRIRMINVGEKIAAGWHRFVRAEIWQQMSWTPVLVILLVGAAYYIGTLQTDVKYLKNGMGGGPSSNAQAAAAPSASAIPTPVPSPPAKVTDSDHIRGNKNAKVVMIEYSDYECPFCKSFHPTTLQALEEYGDKIALVYRHFPLPFHQNAAKEAEAAECINELGGADKFWKYTDTIFERTTSNGQGFALDKLGPLAAELGVNQTAFQSCLDSGKYAKLVADSLAEGQNAGVGGTPNTFIVGPNGYLKLIPGVLPYAQLKPSIDEALKQ